MKILKSGIEMTTEELSKIRAGGVKCACGCQVGFDSGELNNLGDVDDYCECGCSNGPLGFSSTSNSALRRVIGDPPPP